MKNQKLNVSKLRDICSSLTIASAFLYAGAFYSTIEYLDEIGVRGIDLRFEHFIIFSSIAILLAAIVISITSFIGNVWFKLLHFFLVSAMLILILYALIATFWAKEHILTMIQNEVLRTKSLQKINSCVNWNGPNDFLGLMNFNNERPCGDIFNEYYDRKAASNTVLLSFAAVTSTLSVILSGIIYANSDKGPSYIYRQ